MTSETTSDATKREYIGNVFVDHGSVVVLDPMYADVSEKDQERFLEARTGAKIDCDDDNMPEGTDHIGVWVSTGMGDGRYPVYADLIEVPGAGGWSTPGAAWVRGQCGPRGLFSGASRVWMRQVRLARQAHAW